MSSNDSMTATELRQLHQTLNTKVMAYEAQQPPKKQVLIPNEHNQHFNRFEFTQIDLAYAESFTFRLSNDRSEYHFTATLHGKDPEKIRACSIIGDCGNDVFNFHSYSHPWAFGQLLSGHIDYLYSKSCTQRTYSHEDAVADLRSTFADLLWTLRGQLHEARASAPGPDVDTDSDVEDATRKLNEFQEKLEEWKDGAWSMNWEYSPAHLQEGTQDIFPDIDELFTQYTGYRWDAMAVQRARQLRYFGLWLIEREASKKAKEDELLNPGAHP